MVIPLLGFGEVTRIRFLLRILFPGYRTILIEVAFSFSPRANQQVLFLISEDENYRFWWLIHCDGFFGHLVLLQKVICWFSFNWS